MITDRAFIGNGVYASLDQWGTLTLDYGGEGAPTVILNKTSIEDLLVFLRVKSLHDEPVKKLRKALREEIENANS
jgi:hypothetical protein